jgi:hypothetical protein
MPRILSLPPKLVPGSPQNRIVFYTTNIPIKKTQTDEKMHKFFSKKMKKFFSHTKKQTQKRTTPPRATPVKPGHPRHNHRPLANLKKICKIKL